MTEPLSDERLAEIRAGLGMFPPDWADAMRALLSRLDKAEAAIAGILSDWDARGFGRQERYIAPDPDLAGDFGYWSPDARMVGSEHIAKARSCLPPSP